MKRSPIRKVSKSQAEKNQEWSRIKSERIAALLDKYDYLPCERCMQTVRMNMEFVDGHHNDGDRNNNTFDNCRILHRTCHTFVTDHNIKDVPDRLSGN